MKNVSKQKEFEVANGILKLCEEYFGSSLRGSARVSRNFSESKMLVRYLIKKYCINLGWTDIGLIFGVGHDTVINSCSRIPELLDFGGDLKHNYENLCGLIECSDGVRDMIKTRERSRVRFILNDEMRKLDDDDLNDVVDLIRNYKKAKDEFKTKLNEIVTNG